MATETLTLPVHGMTCGNCARSVERKLSATPGVSRVTVDLPGASATVEYDPAQVQPASLAAAVRAIGFEVPA
jgi:copper chaperone CopZ